MTLLFEKKVYALNINGVACDVAAIWRGGAAAPIVFLHGFGSTKEDYADIVHHQDFQGHPFLAFDAPGCGETICADLEKVSIDFQVKTATTILTEAGIERFHLVGHSMGGLTALLLAQAHPERVLSFVNIEGNIAPEDAFLSRQIVDHATPDAEAFLDGFVERTRHAPAFASALYAASLHHKVRAGAVRGIFSSMVALSDHGDLMEKFLNLPCPKMFMYGSSNSDLSYLAHIEQKSVQLCEISSCGHFPMYSNPIEMWKNIYFFISAVSEATSNHYTL